MDTADRLMIWSASGFCLVAAVLALAVLHWSGHAPARQPSDFWRSRSAHGLVASVAWLGMWMLGILASGLLLVLAAALTWQMVDGMGGPRVGLAGGPVESKDMVSNAMSAVALVITAVTLVLTVGTTWLGKQQRLLEAERRKLAENLRSFDQWQAVESVRQRVQAELLEAREATAAWAIRNGAAGPILTERLASLGTSLERLSSPDRRVRVGGFDLLAQMFNGMPNDTWLEPVRRYSESCHALAIARAWYSGEVSHHAQHEALVRAGLWCLVFDEAELRRRVAG